METVRVGMIGVGSNGGGFLDAYSKHPQAEVVAIADPDGRRRVELSARYSVERSYTDAEDVLRSDVDLVSIHAPDRLHTDLVLAALDAGKHVFVEKPLGVSIEQIAAVVRRTDETGKLVAVGQVLRTWPHFRRVKALVESGRLGTVFYLEGNYLTDQLRVIPGIVEKAGRSYSPSILTLGVHVMDTLRWLAGDVVEVRAYRNEGMALPDSPLDECITAIYRFQSGALGQLTTCWGDAAPLAPHYGIGVHGSLGTVRGDRVFLAGAKDWTPLSDLAPEPFPEGGVAAEVDAVVEYLLTGTPVPCDAREGGRSAIACLAALEAAQSGTTVEIARP
jgi:predicted dehydrogenase